MLLSLSFYDASPWRLSEREVGRGEDGGSLDREAERARARQPRLGWTEAGTAVGSALFPLPRPLGPPLPPAVRGRDLADGC